MSTPRTLARTTAAAVAVALVPSVAAFADPATTTAATTAPHRPGRAARSRRRRRPVVGALLHRSRTRARDHAISFPIAGQPVEGFSAIVDGRRPGEYLAMPDNGYGGKAASPDFLIRAYYITPDFKTATGGTGSVTVGDGGPTITAGEFLQFSDPDHHIRFPLVRADRLLTGGDIDPESIQRDHRGDLWIGDEFGPWILHFDAGGQLLEPPIAMPEGLRSPNNPSRRHRRRPTAAASRRWR